MRALPGLALRIAVLVAAVWALHLFIDWLIARAEASASAKMMMFGVLAALLAAYALLIAIPFVPGIEIGLSLLAIRGAEVAPYVYAATVVGLMLAFLAGRWLSYVWLERQLRKLYLVRAADLVRDLAPLSGTERLARLQSRLPRRLAPVIGPWRYLLLAVLINLPGSALIGGGGGICLVAGLSRLFRPGVTLVTLALAVAPAPLVFWWFGLDPSSFIWRP